MFLKIIRYILYIGMFCLFLGCASKEIEYNKPATYWYESIIKEINFGNLEGADGYFASLQSEHINSPLLPEAMLILGEAHMEKDEYLLATFYFDEYLKRYSSLADQDYVRYLKILANYFGFKNYSKDQEFMTQSITDAQEFLQNYPHSRYAPYVEYVYLKFKLGQMELNQSIARVYEKQNKTQAQEIYISRNDEELYKDLDPKPSHIPWYVKILNW
ncbi:outer membrane protein assembly factor BamD [Helicobacter sp. MIT 05-5293]|uniref:outer membrane protein assembly factor BamD n=1 Tax=Helicobacter sp. MIT 05-5293 TaxID=1548149 RepID=UPI00051CD452|nr:outer membrane protein assembly factor BamD [Helicobacter sp. MIT 05-5293]TLD81648.1 outer membrane protein assembly factor BamD [Helicobacter sp. MIT 05-5293]